MNDPVSRREFDNLQDKVEKHGDQLSSTASDIREIKTIQKYDSDNISSIAESVKTISAGMEAKIKDVSKDVTLNKVQIAKLVVCTSPVNGAIAYLVTQLAK